MSLRLGAYVLVGDPEWLRSSLSRYYHRLDDLVLLVPDGGLGWGGRGLPVNECLLAVRDVDVRRISRIVTGSWVDPTHPRLAQVRQRQAGIDALQKCDWVLQIDNDEVVPDFHGIEEILGKVAPEVVGIEWPMRVLYRRLPNPGEFLAVTSEAGSPVYDYPGPIAVRPRARLSDARRPDVASGPVLRCLVEGDEESLQVRQAAGPSELREVLLNDPAAILHNSWGRGPRDIWRKMRTSGHAASLGGLKYFAGTWWPSPWAWRYLRNVHPFSDGLWPRLKPITVDESIFMHGDL